MPVVGRFLNSGYTGVSLFFVLSGFILIYNYPQVSSRTQFWVSRFARVYPAYLLALLLAGLLAVVFPVPGLPLLRPAVLSLLLLQAWFIQDAFILNSPGWTLSVEAFFYLCFPFVLPSMRRVTTAGFAAPWLLWIGVTAVPALLAASPQHVAQALRLANLLEGPLPLTRLPGFLLGIFAGTLYVRRGMPHGRATLAVLLPALVAVAGLLCIAPSVVMGPLRTTALLTAFAAMIFGLAGSRWHGWSNPWVQTAGEISYGIYILQAPVLRICLGLQRRLAPHTHEQAVLFVPVLIAAAYLVFRYVETPARLAIRALSAPPQQTARI